MKRADITTKKLTLEVLEELFRVLDEKEHNTETTYGPTGKMKNKQRWDSELGEYKDVIDTETGEVVMVEEWDYIPKKKDEYSDEDKAMLESIKNIKSHLEKLI